MFAWASAASAREVLTPEEQAERELEAKKRAPPVLVVEPAELNATLGRGETKALLLAVKNAGGQVLRWTVVSSPTWAAPDPRRGELGFGGRIDLAVVIDPAGLAPGANRGELVVAAPGVEGSPATVAIVIQMPAPPAEERRTPAESTGKAGPRAPLPPPPRSGFRPAGPWVLRPTVFRIHARTNLRCSLAPFYTDDVSSDGNGFGFELARLWERGRVDVGFEISMASLETDVDEAGPFPDARYRRKSFFAGAVLAFPAGSKLKGYLSLGISIPKLDIEDIGPSGEDAGSGAEDIGFYYTVGVTYAFSGRFSAEAFARYVSWGEMGGTYADYEADIIDEAFTYGMGFSVHF